MSDVRILGEDDAPLLKRVAPDVFDGPILPHLLREFVEDPRHHMAVAVVDGTVVGFASAVHYLHPDKPPELWVNEIGVSAPFRRQGVGKRLLDALFAHGASLGCREAWVLTERSNPAAVALYRSAGGTSMAGDVAGFSFPLSSA